MKMLFKILLQVCFVAQEKMLIAELSMSTVLLVKCVVKYADKDAGTVCNFRIPNNLIPPPEEETTHNSEIFVMADKLDSGRFPCFSRSIYGYQIK